MQSSRKRLAWLAGGVAVVAVTAAAIWLGFSRLESQITPPRIFGPVFATTQPTGSRPPTVFYVSLEDRSQSEGNLGEDELKYGSSSRIDYAIFELHARDAVTGEATARPVRLATLREAGRGGPSRQPPQIVGYSGETLWVWNLGLYGYSMSTLEATLPLEKLRAANPQVAQHLPGEAGAYKAIGQPPQLVFKGTDARLYAVDPESGRMAMAGEPGSEGHKQLRQEFESGRLTGKSSGSLFHLVRDLKHGGKWYVLADPDAAASLTGFSDRGTLNLGGGDVARSLYVVPYTVDKFDQPILDVAARRQLGEQRYIRSGFLRKPSSPSGVELFRDGGDVVVLHASALGDAGAVQLTKIRLEDGAAAWASSLGLNQFSAYVDAGGSVVFSGDASPSRPDQKRAGLLVFVELSSGTVRLVDLASDSTTIEGK